MTRIFEYIYEISPENAASQLSVGEYLRTKGYTHRILARLKRTENGIRVNGEWVRVDHALQDGDRITVNLEEKEAGPHLTIPVEMPVDIIYQDEDILVVNKPADMPVHPSIGNHDNTLSNALAFVFREDETFTCRIINRLDRDTSGILIIARNALAGAILSDAMKQRKIHRTYLAIVQGRIDEAGTVNAPIARKEGSTIEREVDFEKGETAITHYEPVSYREDLDLSLIKLKLETGRTHQIRVHMGYIGHPLIGDFLYYPDRRYIQRQALHSCRLEFTHPITGEDMVFVQEVPEDMRFME